MFPDQPAKGPQQLPFCTGHCNTMQLCVPQSWALYVSYRGTLPRPLTFQCAAPQACRSCLGGQFVTSLRLRPAVGPPACCCQGCRVLQGQVSHNFSPEVMVETQQQAGCVCCPRCPSRVVPHAWPALYGRLGASLRCLQIASAQCHRPHKRIAGQNDVFAKLCFLSSEVL